jgi:hypothetical protein
MHSPCIVFRALGDLKYKKVPGVHRKDQVSDRIACSIIIHPLLSTHTHTHTHTHRIKETNCGYLSLLRSSAASPT